MQICFEPPLARPYKLHGHYSEEREGVLRPPHGTSSSQHST